MEGEQQRKECRAATQTSLIELNDQHYLQIYAAADVKGGGTKALRATFSVCETDMQVFLCSAFFFFFSAAAQKPCQ